tara:strand:+ start:239 stop:382 length:144 start_codon:yes stop_codon:yes gene_type:complete
MAKAKETTTKTKIKTTSPTKKSSKSTALPPEGSAERKALVLQGLIKE